MSVCGHKGQRFEPLQHQYVVSLGKTLNPHCYSRLSCELSTIREHPREGCFFSAMSFSEEITLKKSAYLYILSGTIS